jgi:hypothetical protein
MLVNEPVWVPAGHRNWASVSLTSERFAIQVQQTAQHDFDFETACNFTAQKLAEDFDGYPLYLGLSGGLDSELVANVMLRNGIKFIPFVLDISGVNDLEVWHAYHWCWRNKVTPVIYKMTVPEFETNFLPNLRRLRDTHQAGLVMILWMADYIAALGGKLITAVAELNLDLDREIFYSNTVDYVLNLFDGGRHPTGFFSYTPELVLSYVKQFDTTVNEQYNKIKFYGVGPRPKYNWTSEFGLVSRRSGALISAWLKKTANSQRHNWGSQQAVIDQLTQTK